MKRWLAYMAIVALLVVLASSPSHAEGAPIPTVTNTSSSGFVGFFLQMTHQEISQIPFIQIGVNEYRRDGGVDVWAMEQPWRKEVGYGNPVQVRLVANVQSVIDYAKAKKSKKITRPITTKWHRPNETGTPPWQDDSHQLKPSDPTDGMSPSVETFFPAQVLNRNTYIAGWNSKTWWLQITNGDQILDELRLFGLPFLSIKTVQNRDLWIPVTWGFVVRCDNQRLTGGNITSAAPPTILIPQSPVQGFDYQVLSQYFGDFTTEVVKYSQNDQTLRTMILDLQACTKDHAGRFDKIDENFAKAREIMQYLLKQNAELNARVTRLEEAWQKGLTVTGTPSITTTGPNVTAAKAYVSYKVVFVYSSRKECWEVSSEDQIREPRVDKAVYVGYKYFDKGEPEDTHWVWNQFVRAEKHGVLNFSDEETGTKTLYASLTRPNPVSEEYRGWTSRTFSVTANTKIVVYPISK